MTHIVPDLTLSIRAHNAEKYIGSAIQSILQQADVQFELIVVDDGSSDAGAAVVRAFDDRRITLLRNERERSAGFCHNLAGRQSRSPFLVTVDADGTMLPGALSKLVRACRKSSTIGMVCSYYFDINGEGKTTRDRFRNRGAFLEKCLTTQSDYRNTLLRYGDISSHLRIYSKQALATVGYFSESTNLDTSYDIAMKISDRFDVAFLPEYLFCHRSDGRAGKTSHETLAAMARRFVYLKRLSGKQTIRFLSNPKYSLNRAAINALSDYVGISKVGRDSFDSALRWLKKAWLPVETFLYRVVVRRLTSRPFRLHLSNQPVRPNPRIAYYTWHFPVLSQTFINREVAALKRSGIDLQIIADEAEDMMMADDNAKSVAGIVTYLDPVDKRTLRRRHCNLLTRRPVEYMKLLCFVISRRHGPEKTLWEDLTVFSRAVYLASVLQEKRIDHVHSPWSDRCSFVAMIAAKLASTTYSVQARAHDIHRKSYLFALQEKFVPARFVITNTRYNELYMKTFLNETQWSKLFVIHNGIDLQRFVPAERQDANRSAAEVRCLCVARLIEPKGLTYLIRACANLRALGYTFRFEIVGGTEDIYMNYYLGVKKLHKQLGLENEVRFLGSLPFAKVLEKYRESDIFVLPCVIASDGSRDITPNAVIEAMAMKLPVISTKIGGIPEIVEDGVSGILIPPNDERALTDAIVQLIKNPERCRELGQNARERVETKFDIDKNIRRYVELFSRAVIDCPYSSGFTNSGEQRFSPRTGGHN